MKYVILILSLALSILIFINYTSVGKYENLSKIKEKSGFITKKQEKIRRWKILTRE